MSWQSTGQTIALGKYIPVVALLSALERRFGFCNNGIDFRLGCLPRANP
jgi:hypothetical protein